MTRIYTYIHIYIQCIIIYIYNMYIWYGCTATCKPLLVLAEHFARSTLWGFCWWGHDCLLVLVPCLHAMMHEGTKGRKGGVYIVKVDHISPTIMINHGDVHQRRFSPLISIGFRIWPTGVFLYACLTLECYVRRGFFDDDLHFFVCEAGVLTCWWILLTKLGCSSH